MRQLEQMLGAGRIARRTARVPHPLCVLQCDMDRSHRDSRRAHRAKTSPPGAARGSTSRDGRRSRRTWRPPTARSRGLSFTQSDPRGPTAPLEPAAPGRARIRAWRAHHGREDERGDRRRAAGRGPAATALRPRRTAKAPATGCSCSTIAAGNSFWSSAASRRWADARHRLDHAVGRHARRGHRAATAVRSGAPGAAAGARRTERRAHPCLHARSVLALSLRRTSARRPPAASRAGAARRASRTRSDDFAEIGVLRRLPADGHDARRARLSRTGVAAAGARSRG